MHDESGSPERNAFERSLAGLIPTAHFDRDGLLFAAGRAAGERDAALVQRSWPRRAWPLATAALALLSAGLGAALVVRSPRTEIVYVARPTLPATPTVARAALPATPATIAAPPRTRSFANFPPESYASLREQALRGVFDRRPANEPNPSPRESSSSPTEPPTYRALRDELLGAAG